MKILFPFVGDSIGGSHISAFTLINFLKSNSKEFKVEVLAFSASDIFKNYTSFHNIEIIEHNIYLKSYSVINLIRDLVRNFSLIRRYLIDNQIDCVHTNDIRMHLIYSFVCLFTKSKHILHLRTLPPKSKIGQLLLFTLPDFIVFISQFIQKDMRISLRDNKFTTITNPVISKQIPSKKEINSKIEKFFKKKTFTISLIANLENPNKNPYFFIDFAFKTLKLFPGKYRFIIAGRTTKDIRRYILEMKAKQYEQEENFREVGFLSNLDMVWKETDFILVPSINEAFGRTPIESMQQGVFVVAHNSGGHRESIQHLSNGFLFDSFEYSECIKVFEKFTKNREKYAEIVHRAYKNTSEFNYVKKHSEKIMKIYKSLDV